MLHRCTKASPAPDCPAVYVLRCRDGTLYTGATTDLLRRLAAHRRGRGAKYTRGRLPFKLVAWWHPRSYALAKSQEARFKRLARAAKLALVGRGEAFGCAIHTGAETTRTS